MAEITRLTGCSDCIDLEFVERERTPRRLMKLCIYLHLIGLSFSKTIKELEKFGVQRSRKTIHDWVQKTDLQPVSDKQSDYVALDETVLQIDDEQYWLDADLDHETDRILHVRLFQPVRPR